MAIDVRRIPDTLYNYSLDAVVANYNVYQEDTRSISRNMLFDIYFKLHAVGQLKRLGVEFSVLDNFKKLLNVKDKRCLLHTCFQAIMDNECPVASELSKSFQTLCTSAYNSTNTTKNHVIKLGFSLGSFLLDAGWFPESDIVYSACLSLCKTCDIAIFGKCILHCLTKLLCVRNVYCKFEEGKQTFKEANEFIDKIKESGIDENFACIYSEFSSYYSAQHNYADTYRWSVKALRELNSTLNPKDIVKILCQAAKACILKREFKRSEMLIKQALLLAKKEFGSQNLCFAAALEDYGYYLLSVDAVGPAVKVFKSALTLHASILGGNNLLVAKCHENLAYASYSHDYSSGLFNDAMNHADRALSIMLNLLDDDSFLLSSAKRVKALILEEIALSCHDLSLQNKYFAEAQEFHTSALELALQAFGELNMHTAKHYGNLGRLFQSMRKFKKAQNMQLKAIAIKEAVLGPDDYEVGSSIGHLASLYTYDMELHKEAETLFLRSLEINKKLFGEGYSGHEYDYRGLLRVYTKLGLSDEVLKYRTIFHEWKIIRDQTAQADIEFSPLCIESESISPEDIMEHFISIH